MTRSPLPPETSPPAAEQGWTAKLRLAEIGGQLQRNMRLVMMAGGGLICIVSSLALFDYYITVSTVTIAPPPKLETAFALLDSGQYVPAREAAERIQAGRELDVDEYGTPAYIIGASLLYEADETIDPGDRAQRFRVASRYLERAQQRGFPHGRETEGLLLLGRSLHESGQYAPAIVALRQLEEKSSKLRPTAQRLLASCYLRSDPPQLDLATEKADAVLATPNLSVDDREVAQLLYGETLLLRQDFTACAELVAKIPSSSRLYPQAMLFKGRSLLAAAQMFTAASETDGVPAAEIAALYAQAIEALRAAHSRRAADHATTREAAYLVAVALRRSGKLPEAQSQFLRVRKTYYESCEGIAASLEEAELAAELGSADAALAAYQQTIAQMKAAPHLVNPWISNKQLAERLVDGYEHFIANHQYTPAVKLAQSLAPPLELERTLAMIAAAHQQWGDHLQHAAARNESAEGHAQRAAARAQFRAAGEAYVQLAEVHLSTRRYTDDLWQAGQSFAAGRDYERAVALYRQYLQQESKRERPAVLVKLGEALLSLDRVDDALAALEECLRSFPKDPASYSARLLASRAHLEKNNLAAAKAMLETNLHHESLTPRSDVWRESLFALGSLLHDEGQAKLIERQLAEPTATQSPAATASLESAQATLQEALRYLTEAVERYPQAPESTRARFQAAEAHRHSAQLPLVRLQTEAIESRRAALSAQAQTELKAALAVYEELTTMLNRQADEGPLLPVEHAILRNAYFARGGVLYDMGEFERAIQAYSTATNRYQNEPAAVEAYVQIASCYRRLNKPLEARGTIEQAKLVIDRMPPDAEFTKTTRFARDEWNTLLDWLSGT